MAREVLLSGGFGSGKSLALALKLAMRAREPGAHELLVRKFNATLHRSTLRTLLEGDGETPAVLPPGTYSHHKQHQQINLHGGGSISYLGCDEPQKLGSINATGAAIDEAAELSESDLIMLRGRCRTKHPRLSNQVYMATNPKGPRHHLAIRFGLDGVSKCASGAEAIFARTDENPNLPQDYVNDIASLTGSDRARYFEGRWTQAEGLVYPQFNRTQMVRHREGPWTEVVVGQDAGFNDPDVLLVVCRDGQDRIHVADEWCRSGQLMDAVIEQAHSFRERYGAQRFAVDPSAARLRETMISRGLNAERAESPVLDGIRAVQRYMTIEGDGTPRFTVDPVCDTLIRELETYSWHPDRPDTPVDKFNHACDALRYAVMAVDRPRPTYEVRCVGGDGEDDENFGVSLSEQARLTGGGGLMVGKEWA